MKRNVRINVVNNAPKLAFNSALTRVCQQNLAFAVFFPRVMFEARFALMDTLTWTLSNRVIQLTNWYYTLRADRNRRLGLQIILGRAQSIAAADYRKRN